MHFLHWDGGHYRWEALLTYSRGRGGNSYNCDTGQVAIGPSLTLCDQSRKLGTPRVLKTVPKYQRLNEFARFHPRSV